MLWSEGEDGEGCCLKTLSSFLPWLWEEQTHTVRAGEGWQWVALC